MQRVSSACKCACGEALTTPSTLTCTGIHAVGPFAQVCAFLPPPCSAVLTHKRQAFWHALSSLASASFALSSNSSARSSSIRMKATASSGAPAGSVGLHWFAKAQTLWKSSARLAGIHAGICWLLLTALNCSHLAPCAHLTSSRARLVSHLRATPSGLKGFFCSPMIGTHRVQIFRPLLRLRSFNSTPVISANSLSAVSAKVR